MPKERWHKGREESHEKEVGNEAEDLAHQTGDIAGRFAARRGLRAHVLMGLGGAAAIGSYKWMEGTMEKDYPRSMQDTWNATLAAC